VTHIIRARDPRESATGPAIDRSAEAIAAHVEDAAHFPGGRADGVARPKTEGEVAALVAAAPRVLAIGAQSSVTGGATPAGGLVLASDRLTAIRDVGACRVRAGAGVALQTLQDYLRPRNFWFPPAPTFLGAFVGGVVATNAAGAATFKYGTTRDWVDGITVVLPCGHVLDLERGAAHASAREGLVISCAHGARAFKPGSYVMPDVPKCSAGYFARPEMDLIDLFIGSEGTLGVIVEATLRVETLPAATVMAMVPVRSEATGLALVETIRRTSRHTWATKDPDGVDVSAIEHLDRRCLRVLREDGVDRAQGLSFPEETQLLLLMQLELPAGLDASRAYDDIAGALGAGEAGSPLARFCGLLSDHGVFEDAEIAMPGDARRMQQFLAAREAAPAGVNRRVGDARRLIDGRIDKTAADMIVPFDRFADMMTMYRDGYARRGLDYAIWGHISDGNVHPNVIPRSYDDVVAGREAILEFGREVVRLGGSPLAEHGVGRSVIKQQLLRELYGEAGIADMRAIKQAIDPDWKLAPGVLFPAP
jgi:D-lactate dehydrogenase (cytochrome)